MKRKTILSIMFCMALLSFSMIYCTAKKQPLAVKKSETHCDSLGIYKVWLKEVRTQIEADSVMQIAQSQLIEQLASQNHVYQDSLYLFRKTPLMNEDLFLKVYRYERLLYYYNIIVRNSSQKAYWWGWSSRVFKGEEDKK